MRKARLGFKIYSLDDELLVEEDKDFVRKEKDKKWATHQKSKARKLRCYNKHKEQYNAQRRRKASTIRGKFLNSRKKATDKGHGWELSQSEWEDLWLGAGFVRIPGTISVMNPTGEVRTAFSIRGPNRLENTMMTRKDLSTAWSPTNCYIVYRGEPLEGSYYHTVTM